MQLFLHVDLISYDFVELTYWNVSLTPVTTEPN
jgi:hypothetical protein